MLKSRLPPELVNDPTARKGAMKEFVDWHKIQISNFVKIPKHAGSTKGAVKKALKPILSLVGFLISHLSFKADLYCRRRISRTTLGTT